MTLQEVTKILCRKSLGNFSDGEVVRKTPPPKNVED
jgi:hypothetical protein